MPSTSGLVTKHQPSGPARLGADRMIISVINHTKDVKDEDIHGVLRAVNRQITYDFQPYWSLTGTLRLEGKSTRSPTRQSLADMRGDAVIYLWDNEDIDDALGYHEENHRGIPYSFVFTKLAKELGEDWSVTLSHEAIELLGDPECNLLVQGPHPATGKLVFHWYELCDAVQAESYQVDGITVSNFVLPLYFTSARERGGRNDFLGRAGKHGTLRSFTVNEGGYIGFFNPANGKHETYEMDDDKKAEKRHAIKGRFAVARRGGRYDGKTAARIRTMQRASGAALESNADVDLERRM